MAAFGVPAEDDDGNGASGRQNGQQGRDDPPSAPSITTGRRKAIEADMAACKTRHALSDLWNSLDGTEQDLMRQQFNKRRTEIPPEIAVAK